MVGLLGGSKAAAGWPCRALIVDRTDAVLTFLVVRGNGRVFGGSSVPGAGKLARMGDPRPQVSFDGSRMIGSLVSLDLGVRVSGSSAVDEDPERLGTRRPVSSGRPGNAVGTVLAPRRDFRGGSPDTRAEVPAPAAGPAVLFWPDTAGEGAARGGARDPPAVGTAEAALLPEEATVAAESVRVRTCVAVLADSTRSRDEAVDAVDCSRVQLALPGRPPPVRAVDAVESRT